MYKKIDTKQTNQYKNILCNCKMIVKIIFYKCIFKFHYEIMLNVVFHRELYCFGVIIYPMKV